MSKPRVWEDRLVMVLREIGPMTAEEIAAELGILRTNVDTILRRMKKPDRARRVYVKEWLVAPEVRICTRVLAAGNKKDAPKPVYSKRAADTRYAEKLKAQKEMKAKLFQIAGNPFSTLIAQVTQ